MQPPKAPGVKSKLPMWLAPSDVDKDGVFCVGAIGLLLRSVQILVNIDGAFGHQSINISSTFVCLLKFDFMRVSSPPFCLRTPESLASMAWNGRAQHQSVMKWPAGKAGTGDHRVGQRSKYRGF